MPCRRGPARLSPTDAPHFVRPAETADVDHAALPCCTYLGRKVGKVHSVCNTHFTSKVAVRDD